VCVFDSVPNCISNGQCALAARVAPKENKHKAQIRDIILVLVAGVGYNGVSVRVTGKCSCGDPFGRQVLFIPAGGSHDNAVSSREI
jgi:hypothetical protein